MRGSTHLAAAGVLGLLAAAPDHRVYGYENIRRTLQRQKSNPARGANASISTGNRHGGPNKHKREIARRNRQQGRV